LSQPFDLILRSCRLPDGTLADVAWRDGVIATLSPDRGSTAARTVDCGGRIVTPGRVDAHVHLDKAVLAERAPGIDGTVAEAIRVTGLAKRRFTVEDIQKRARTVLDLAVSHGTTAMRSHVEVDWSV